jgi:3,4-dihydroxy 2-butanone 4-phosphate synthase/GTP cyclohydrolase II
MRRHLPFLVDLLGHGCTTGISAHDRGKNGKALIDPIQNRMILEDRVIFSSQGKKGAFLEEQGIEKLLLTWHDLRVLNPAGG